MIVKKNNERSLNLSARTPYSKGVDEVQSYRNIRRMPRGYTRIAEAREKLRATEKQSVFHREKN